jgi:hypothetical protein
MSKGTTIRTIRVPDDLWGAALRYANTTDTNVSEVIRVLLRAWIDGDITVG